VKEVLAEFEAEFASVANAVENGEFALWVGSGISRQAPTLGALIERAFDYIRERAIDPATADAYARAGGGAGGPSVGFPGGFQGGQPGGAGGQNANPVVPVEDSRTFFPVCSEAAAERRMRDLNLGRTSNIKSMFPFGPPSGAAS